ncbi:MAG: ACT domain-containing protein [Candidatus Melainabacteria bacterium]|nr:ACT domain-containing protein [Candidatus Melainabacteria bacterium]
MSSSYYKVVVSGVGHDRPGMVAALAEVLCQFECNIEDSTMTRLAHEFAMILIISVPVTISLPAIQSALQAVEERVGLTLVAKLLNEDFNPVSPAQGPKNGAQPYLISVAGRDRTGITHQVAQHLSQLQVNITDLNARIIEGEDSPVYLMMLEVEAPAALASETLKQSLASLAKAISVEIQVREIEAAVF